MNEAPPDANGEPPRFVLYAIYAALLATLIAVFIIVGVYV